MWGKRRITTLLRLDSVAIAALMVGRILAKLMKRGVVVLVATLPQSRRLPLPQAGRPAALRPPPAERAQADAAGEMPLVVMRPYKAINHCTPAASLPQR